jgi:hypothetical protein
MTLTDRLYRSEQDAPCIDSSTLQPHETAEQPHLPEWRRRAIEQTKQLGRVVVPSTVTFTAYTAL